MVEMKITDIGKGEHMLHAYRAKGVTGDYAEGEERQIDLDISYTFSGLDVKKNVEMAKKIDEGKIKRLEIEYDEFKPEKSFGRFLIKMGNHYHECYVTKIKAIR